MRNFSLPKAVYYLRFSGYCLLLGWVLTGCAAAKSSFDPGKTYPREQLQEDYHLFRAILEDAHPSLYWYTTRDSLNYYFDKGYQQIADSMTEPQFRTLLSFVISKVNCGHTSVQFSKSYAKYIDTVTRPSFPLGIKFWDDTAAVYINLNRRDSVLTRGTVVTSINQVPINTIRDSLFRFMVTDGYSINHKYQSLSNLGSFGGLYQAVFGAPGKYSIGYIDKDGTEKEKTIGLYDIRRDTSFRNYIRSLPTPDKKEKKQTVLNSTRNIQIDTGSHTAFMTVSSFNDHNHLKSFFKKSFKVVEKENIKNLIIDLRFNGGGNVSLSNCLTRYLVDHEFKLADSLYATKRLSNYERYLKNSFSAFFFMHFVTKKRSDGLYHFGYYERHHFKPRTSHHFDGNIYILQGGNTFSASTLLVNAIKGQQNVKIVGEETGGGAYGNTAWFIPDATLPNTKIRFRVPRFRMVMNVNYPKNGRGIVPDVEVKPSVEAIRTGVDTKIEYLKKVITGQTEAGSRKEAK